MRLRCVFVLWCHILCVQGAFQEKTKTDAKNSPSSPKEESSITSKNSLTYYRLPTSLRPLHYFVRLQPFINGNFSIHGYTEITFEVLSPTSDVVLHIRDIITKNETLKIYELGDTNKTSLPIRSQTYENERQFYNVSLGIVLQKGKSFVMQLQFVGLLNDKLLGFYRSSYQDAQGNKRWLAATQFQAPRARMAFPCFDEPAMRAEFSIQLVREEGMTSLSNMPRIETIPEPNQKGWFIDKFQKSVKMSSYLVAFLISDFDFVGLILPDDRVTIRVWSRKEAINQTDYALRNANQTLHFFEDYFNVSYPLPKMDLAALPDFLYGAMENWGLITYRENYLLYDPEQSSESTKDLVGSFNAHEIAHMWFGNLVTPLWWSHIWLSEGFATYMTDVAHDAIEPSMRIADRFVGNKQRTALTEDSFYNSHPISVPIRRSSDMQDLNSAIVYAKGAAIIRMMRHYLGENTFKDGITKYLNEFAFSAAKQDDLWHSMTLQALEDESLPTNVTVKEIMDSWTLQKGFPVLRVYRDGNGTANLTQEKFLFYKSENQSDLDESKWWIPVTFTSEKDSDFSSTYPREWMTPTDDVKTIEGMPSNDQWVIFNILQTAFYRVNYDDENWKQLINQLNVNHTKIHTLNRVQLIGDALHLARAGLLSYTIPLEMLSYLQKETEFVPLSVAVHDTAFIYSIIRYTDHDESFKAFYLSLLVPHYKRLGFLERPEDSYMDQKTRSLVLAKACRFKYKPCIDNAVNLYQQLMQDPQNSSIIDPNLRRTVFCVAIREGGNAEWDFAWDRYVTSDFITEKNDILSALGCTLNLTIKERLMNLAFKPDGPIRKHDSSRTFTSIITDRNSSIMAWNYVKENWDHISQYAEDKRRSLSILQGATKHIITNEELAEMNDFIASTPQLRRQDNRNLNRLREKILGRIQWRVKSLPTILKWLSENGYRKEINRETKINLFTLN